MKLVLASSSPRRKELLNLAGLDFEVLVSDVDESFSDALLPNEAVELLSKRKALAVEKLVEKDRVVLAADTVVAYDGKILGKPHSDEEALDMLRMLSGKTHNVFTGVCIIGNGKELNYSVKSEVKFYDLTDDEIKAYIATGEPSDKAGAYGIQGKGSLLVESINGDYFNIVGLPIASVVRSLKEFE